MLQRTASNKVLGFGDPVLDVITSVSFENLASLQMQPGGCTSIERSELHRLLSLEHIKTDLVKLPGGSAANVMKGISGLRGNESTDVAFVGMIGQDTAGVEYKSMLESHGVTPVLPACTAGDAATATCLCLISPDGQRTMRTYLGAAQELSSPEHLPEDLIPSNQGLVHFEGYAMYKPAVTLAIMRAARAAGAKISLDLASFEVVKGCWEVLSSILEEKLIDIVFCNEDEARGVCTAAALLEKATETAAEEIGKAVLDFLLRYVEVAVMTRGKQGCVVATAGGQQAEAPAEGVAVVDTVGAGDYFSAGFLHAWIEGAALEACAACGCAAGAAAVQVAGADLKEEDMQRLRGKVQSILDSAE